MCYCRSSLFLRLCAISVICATAFAAPKASKLDRLPGFNGTLPSLIYSGYETLNETEERRLFYFFVESENNPSEDPLLVWLAGGPGCSSFTGLFFEIGPFYFVEDVTLKPGEIPRLVVNKNSWTQISNVIFLDSPIGTGYSYARNVSQYDLDDDILVADIYAFLLKWMEDFPEFKSNPLYIAGDSYAGTMIPLLSQYIHNKNEAGRALKLNLKGYLTGNGKTDEYYDAFQVPYAYGMGLISDEFYQKTRKACNDNYVNSSNAVCQSLLDDFNELTEGLNQEHILKPKCFDASSVIDGDLSREGGNTETFRRAILDVDKYGSLQHPLGIGENNLLCPPGGVYFMVKLWADNAHVRKALHAEQREKTGEWGRCRGRFRAFYYIYPSVIEYHRRLTMSGYRALIYSGDHDLKIPFVGASKWVKSLGYSKTSDWRPWFVDGQVVGYVTEYDNNMTFTTIKGGGHTAPEHQPEACYGMFQRWISGNPL